MMKVYHSPFTRPRCSIMMEHRKRSRLEEEYASSSSDDDDDSLLSSEESDSDDISDVDEEEDSIFPHSTVRFASTTCSAKASHFRPPKALCWWSRQDRQQFVSECHDLLEDATVVPPEVVDHYQRTWEQAQSGDTSSTVSSLQLPTELRGLEWGLQSKQAPRKEHLTKLLELQAKTKQRLCSSHVRERLLANYSIKSSRPSRVISQWLGAGDAKSLQEQSQQESIQRSSVNVNIDDIPPPSITSTTTMLPPPHKKRKM